MPSTVDDTSGLRPVDVLHVAIFHTDLGTGSAAMRFYAQFVEALRGEYLVDLTLWRIDAAAVFTTGTRAAAAAAVADVIVLGMREGERLPFAARRWVQEITQRRAGRQGIIVKITVPAQADGASFARHAMPRIEVLHVTPAESGDVLPTAAVAQAQAQASARNFAEREWRCLAEFRNAA
jgi:hypothetical protein